MTLSVLRLILAGLWVGFWLFTCVCIMLAPMLRSDHFIHPEHIMGLIAQVSGLWLPPLSCFVAFWFPAAQRKSANKIVVEAEQKIGAIGLTVAYMAVVVMMLMVPLYYEGYDRDVRGELVGGTVYERTNEVVKFALLLSPLILAPISYLTGGHLTQTRRTPSNPADAAKNGGKPVVGKKETPDK